MPRPRDERHRAIPGYCAVTQGRRERRSDEECTLYRGQGSEVLEGIDDECLRRVLVISAYRTTPCLGQFTPAIRDVLASPPLVALSR
jgi:hypothetical protein